jgi:hypothetical protein
VTIPPDVQGAALDATIDWGDGTTSAGTIAGGTVSGTHTYAAPYAYPAKVTISDRYSAAQLASASELVQVPATAQGTVGGTVPATLALTLGAPASFGPFTPGVEHTYTATTTADVVSTAGDATLSVSPVSAGGLATASLAGHLANGAFTLPQPLQVAIAPSSWSGPVSHATSNITFTQPIGANDPLRTGTYSKTLTFTLSTTQP